MKKVFFIATAFIAATSLTGNLQAQEAAKTAGYDLKKNVKCRISNSSSGCDFTFTNDIVSPRDPASGLPTGKRQHKPFSFSVSSTDNSVTEVTTPKNTASKTSGGKASFSDLSVTITIKGKSQKLSVVDGEFTLPENCPNGECALAASWSWGASNSGSSKRCSVDFLLEIQDGVCMAIKTKGMGAQD